jgi:hypothetical protein
LLGEGEHHEIRTIRSCATDGTASDLADEWECARGTAEQRLLHGATTIRIPFSEVLDTSEATTDGDDAQLNETCHGQAGPFAQTDASAWL